MQLKRAISRWQLRRWLRTGAKERGDSMVQKENTRPMKRERRHSGKEKMLTNRDAKNICERKATTSPRLANPSSSSAAFILENALRTF